MESQMPKVKSKEALLVFPGKFRAPDPQIPLPLLHVASSLKQAKYEVRILDMRLVDYRNVKLGDPFFVGISSMSGQQIGYGLEFAKKVRNEAPSCPIVWGGVHPTLLPELTAESDSVDVVVRGECELSIVELANKLYAKRSIDEVAGITYKSKGKVKSNPNGPLINLNYIPIELPYDLLALDKYPALKAGRFHIQTSRGCPSRCGFCYNTVFNERKWRCKSAKRVLDEIEFIIGKFPNVKVIDPIDDNFFVDQKRVEDICKGLIERQIKVNWRANCRFDYLSTYSQAFVSLLEKSGCFELDFGGETGSKRLQEIINKDVTFEQMTTAVENLGKWAPSIEPFVSWLSGLPTETEEDLGETLNLMDKMSKINSKTQHYGIFVYTPFPSPLLDVLRNEFTPPKSLEEWGDIEVFHFSPPWHSRKYIEKLHTVSAVSRYAFYPKTRITERELFYRLGYSLMNHLAKFRWKHRYFGFPIELKIINWVARELKGYL
jgi:radical SAM superfamily enzyme YgiQ (UPF0313 family)